MTTSNSSLGSSALVHQEAAPGVTLPPTTLGIRHTLASRFAFLLLCVAIILSALAYGTVHYWALAVFFLGAVLMLILWLADGWALGRIRISRNVLQLSLLGMFLLGLIQLLPLRSAETAGISSLPFVRSLSLDPYATRFILIQVAALLIYFAATLVFVDTPNRLRLLVRTITIFGFLLAVFGLTQSFTTSKVYWIRELPQSQPFGPFINRHHFAGYMELAMALPLGLLFSGSLEKEKRFIYLFAVILMSVALIMTNSRGGLISLIAEILFLVAVAGFRRRTTRRKSSEKSSRIKSAVVRAGLAFVLVVSVLGAVTMLGGESGLTRLLGSLNTDDPTTGRAHFWSVTVDIIKTHPILGIGLGAFSVVYTGYDSRNGLFRLEQAHNDYLQVLSDGGIVGAALGLFFVFSL
ncbi:MAG TPA: O-antigen ligase family protein, partial [Pyrinomonadaceae bacterium]|nr:O-antigen ligase family protein [Pyrinomonadaceae bacterium]